MDMTATQGTILAVVLMAELVGQVLDCATTDKGLAHGMIEANSIAGKIYSKIGAMGFFGLKCMALPLVSVLLGIYAGWGFGVVTAAPLAVIGFIAFIKNYLLLKKNGIATF